jgi:hypothetical protein
MQRVLKRGAHGRDLRLERAGAADAGRARRLGDHGLTYRVLDDEVAVAVGLDLVLSQRRRPNVVAGELDGAMRL